MRATRFELTLKRRWLGAFVMAGLLSLIAACGGGDDPTPTTAAPTPTSVPAWEVDLEQTLEAANVEGTVVINVARAPYREGAEFFMQSYPGITVETIVARGGDMTQRLVREHDAGIYSLDVYLSGANNALTVLVPSGIAGDTRSLLVRPDIIEDENWIGTFDDQWHDTDTKKHVFSHWAFYGSAASFVNREVVSEEEFNSIDDLFKPELKGNWCLFDPRGFGSGAAWVAGVLVTKGTDFLRRLLEETEPVLHRDDRQTSQDLIRGEYAFCVTSQVPTFHLEGVGLHVEELIFEPGTIAPEFAGAIASTCCGTGTGNTSLDGYISSGIGGPVYINNAPNPNASKIFLNWLGAREGALDYMRPHNFTYCSARVDLQDQCPYDPIEEGKSYLSTDRTETQFVRELAGEIATEVFGGR